MQNHRALALAISLTIGVLTAGGTMSFPVSPSLAAGTRPAAAVFRLHEAAPTFSAVMVHVEQMGTRINPSNPSLTRVGVGQAVRIVMYVHVTGLSQPTQANATLTIRQGGRRVFYSTGTFTVDRSLMGGSSSGWMWFSNKVPPCSGTLKPLICLPPVPGRYAANGVFRMGGRQGQQTTVFSEQ